MSNFLAVDTSSNHLTVAAQKGDKKVVGFLPDCAMKHSVVLMDEIDRVLDELNLTPAECDFFAAVTGPGSFTGIRIGIATVKGFSVALKKKAFGVTAFDMLSYNINSESDYLIAIDALHGYYYVAGYGKDGVCDISPRYVSGEELKLFNRPVYGYENLPLENYTRLNAGECLYAAVLGCEQTGGGLSALYIRMSQAEEERLKRGGSV